MAEKDIDLIEYMTEKNGRLTLGRAIRADRMCEDMTQKELAKAVGVTKQAISGFEAGTSFPSFATMKKIADIFEMDVQSYVRLMLVDLMVKKGIEGYDITLTKVKKSV